jgi:hypothetical protein
MDRSQRFLPQPTLTPQHWCRHGWNALRHKRSGIVVYFRGPNPTKARNETLQRLNKMAPTKPAKIRDLTLDCLD